METLICNKPFNLNSVDENGQAVMKRYAFGDVVSGKDAEHWYAKAHCSVSKKEAEKSADRDPIQDALKTKALVKSMITEENPTPKMGDLNAALKEADLPKLENAEARDLILADIAKESEGQNASNANQ